MHAEKKETLLQNQSISQRLLQIVVLKSLPQRGCYFLRKKLIQHFIRQAKLNMLAQGYNHPVYDFDDNKTYVVI